MIGSLLQQAYTKITDYYKQKHEHLARCRDSFCTLTSICVAMNGSLSTSEAEGRFSGAFINILEQQEKT